MSTLTELAQQIAALYPLQDKTAGKRYRIVSQLAGMTELEEIGGMPRTHFKTPDRVSGRNLVTCEPYTCRAQGPSPTTHCMCLLSPPSVAASSAMEPQPEEIERRRFPRGELAESLAGKTNIMSMIYFV